MYIWKLTEWPNFSWDQKHLEKPLAAVRHEQGRLLGRMESLGFKLREEAVLRTLTQDVLKTSEIEGEKLDPAQVRSSIARRLRIDIGALAPADRNVDGIVEVMLDATSNYDQPLMDERLWGWHAALFPTGRSGRTKKRVGNWREDSTGPMQVISGSIGKEKIHYTAPPAAVLSKEMRAFIDWFNENGDTEAVIKAGVAHLWFVTVHPFDDGNGRIARAIADMSLARSEKSPQRFYSMSAQIRAERNDYYNILEKTQKSSLDITPWLQWFLACLNRAITGAQGTLSSVMSKARFWEKHAGASLNERQVKVLNRLLDGFQGNLTSSKWAKLTDSSQDTAYRDIVDLVERGILRKSLSSGRSTNYELVDF